MTYEIKHGKKSVHLPAFGDIPTGVVRRARLETQQDQSWFILEQTLSEDDLAVVDELPLSVFAEHMKKWTGAVGLGEY